MKIKYIIGITREMKGRWLDNGIKIEPRDIAERVLRFYHIGRRRVNIFIITSKIYETLHLFIACILSLDTFLIRDW